MALGFSRKRPGSRRPGPRFPVAGGRGSGRLFLGSYPIPPASDVLHELAGFKNFPVYTFQAEDEIAGMASAIGAAFGGAISVTTTPGPGMNLKAQAVGLAVNTQTPAVYTDIHRPRPSIRMP